MLRCECCEWRYTTICETGRIQLSSEINKILAPAGSVCCVPVPLSIPAKNLPRRTWFLLLCAMFIRHLSPAAMATIAHVEPRLNFSLFWSPFLLTVLIIRHKFTPQAVFLQSSKGQQISEEELLNFRQEPPAHDGKRCQKEEDQRRWTWTNQLTDCGAGEQRDPDWRNSSLFAGKRESVAFTCGKSV